MRGEKEFARSPLIVVKEENDRNHAHNAAGRGQGVNRIAAGPSEISGGIYKADKTRESIPEKRPKTKAQEASDKRETKKERAASSSFLGRWGASRALLDLWALRVVGGIAHAQRPDKGPEPPPLAESTANRPLRWVCCPLGY